MKTLFMPIKLKPDIDKPEIISITKKIPKNIAIAYSIQYQKIALKIKKTLSKKHKITKFIQVLGCSKPSFPKSTQAILLISSGRFHGIALASETKLPVYILERNVLKAIPKKEVEIIEKKKKGAYIKFLNAKKIGILISTKPDQQNLKKATELKKKFNKKQPYLFICNNLDVNEFENFGIESWVNTACSRLDMNDASIINLDEIKNNTLG